MPSDRRVRRERQEASEAQLHPPESLDDATFAREDDDLVEGQVVEEDTLADRAPTLWDRLQRDYVLLALLALAVLANLALLAFLLLRYDALPDPLPLHFDATGLPDRIEAKTGILALPAIGLVVFGMNVALGLLVYRRERAAAVLLAVGALFVQILMWLATINVASG